MLTDIIAIAQALARNCNWAVFPCGDDKRPAIPKFAGGNGFHDASTDPDVIYRLFHRRNATLIGVVTGAISGVDVLDVDVKHDAARAWLLAAESRLPPTRAYRTQGGGFHLYFQHAEGVRNTESTIAKGIDTRGSGGYAVFWFAAGFECLDHSPIAEWPDWLRDALLYQPPQRIPQQLPARAVTGARGAQRLVDAQLGRVRTAAEGSRHHTLRAASFTIGGLLSVVGMSNSEAADRLLEAIVAAGGNAVVRRNAQATIAWGLKRGAALPLQLGSRR